MKFTAFALATVFAVAAADTNHTSDGEGCLKSMYQHHELGCASLNMSKTCGADCLGVATNITTFCNFSTYKQLVDGFAKEHRNMTLNMTQSMFDADMKVWAQKTDLCACDDAVTYATECLSANSTWDTTMPVPETGCGCRQKKTTSSDKTHAAKLGGKLCSSNNTMQWHEIAQNSSMVVFYNDTDSVFARIVNASKAFETSKFCTEIGNGQNGNSAVQAFAGLVLIAVFA